MPENVVLLAQDAPPARAPQPGLVDMLLPVGLIILIFWFLVFRPTKKAQQALKDKVDGMKKGDRVRTRGGLLGTVARVDETEVTLKIDLEGKVRVRVAKDALEDVVSKDGAKSEK